MNFHETKGGRIFFEHQLPQLITTLQEIAQALQRPAPMAIQFPVEIPPRFLEDLYSGMYEPESEKDLSSNKVYYEAAAEYQDRLKAQVSPEIWKQIEEYKEILERMYTSDIEQDFVSGFRCAMKMVIAGLAAK